MAWWNERGKLGQGRGTEIETETARRRRFPWRRNPRNTKRSWHPWLNTVSCFTFRLLQSGTNQPDLLVSPTLDSKTSAKFLPKWQEYSFLAPATSLYWVIRGVGHAEYKLPTLRVKIGRKSMRQVRLLNYGLWPQPWFCPWASCAEYKRDLLDSARYRNTNTKSPSCSRILRDICIPFPTWYTFYDRDDATN